MMVVMGGLYLLLQALLVLGWKRYRPPAALGEEVGISVVICAHDEEENLRRFLPSVLEQAYGAFEVVVVLDRCGDGSLGVLEEFGERYSALRVLEVKETQEGWASKKYALREGIRAARYSVIALTDADCWVEKDWLKQLRAHLGGDTQLVLGLGLYYQYGGWLNRFIRYETLYTAFQYVGLAQWGMPYMGVGRNMCYRKSFFVDTGELGHVKERLSGDDDLLVNAFADGRRTAVMLGEGSESYSEPKRSWGGWILQKFRHVSASNAYSWRSKAFLGLFHFSHLLFYIFFGINLSIFLCDPFLKDVVCIYVIRIMVSWGLFGMLRRLIRSEEILIFFPILDFLYFLYNISIVPLGLIVKPGWQKRNDVGGSPTQA